MAAGLVWALPAGYARRLAPDRLRGKAVAVVMAGIPVALALGVPGGALLGGWAGRRAVFSAVTVVAVVLIGWIALTVPDLPGGPRGGRIPIRRTLAVPGVVPVLFVTLAFVLAPTVLHTCLAAFLGRRGMAGSIDLVLPAFGAASLLSVWVVGAHIDRRPRGLVLASAALFASAAAILATGSGGPGAVYTAAVL
ncbi:MFS transporter [Streptomyces sp. NPDC014894]|uniref:MFS transporter n=1 Tax=Streptomyces sp. NPDC014894 TaxID=3364931 RepID=UPI0036F9A0C8